MAEQSIMIVGLGDLGGHVLEFLARVPNIPRIITADINEDWGTRKTNSAIVGASQFNPYPDIRFIALDAFNIEKTAKVLQEVKRIRWSLPRSVRSSWGSYSTPRSWDMRPGPTGSPEGTRSN